MSSSLLSLDLKRLKLPSWLSFGGSADGGSSGLKVKYPPVGFDVGGTHLALARLAREKDRSWSLTSHEVVEIPAELLDSEAFRARIRSADRMRAMVAGALQKEGVRTGTISVVLPDHLARVALMPFEELPRSRRELLELVRWKMKKAVPFKVEEATVDYQILPPGAHAGNGAPAHTVLAVLIPRSVVEEHEALFTGLGIRPGLVDLSSFSLTHLYRPVIEQEVPRGDFMLANVTPVFFSVLVYRHGTLIFYRCKSFALGGAEESDASARTIQREAQASLLYYQERLEGRELARIYMRVVGQDPARVFAAFEGAPCASPPELIDPGRVVKLSGRLAAVGSERSLEMMQRLAPAVGAALGRNLP